MNISIGWSFHHATVVHAWVTGVVFSQPVSTSDQQLQLVIWYALHGCYWHPCNWNNLLVKDRFNKPLVCLLLCLCICVTNLVKDRFNKVVNTRRITSIFSLVPVINTQCIPSIFRLANAYSVIRPIIRLAYLVVISQWILFTAVQCVSLHILNTSDPLMCWLAATEYEIVFFESAMLYCIFFEIDYFASSSCLSLMLGVVFKCFLHFFYFEIRFSM
jgi:hypothetical protein